jgi:Sulfatase
MRLHRRPVLATTALLVASLTTLAVVAAPSGSKRQHTRPDVILLVLDEFPGDSLRDANGAIDAVRYPNFAALAGDSTWFRNAYSVYDSTTKAVPLILDGMRPTPGSQADQRYHPRSIFTALAGRGYRTVSSEEATAICPPRLCRGARTRRPAILPRLASGREKRFNRFVRRLRPGRRPTLWMKHVMLPHGPYLYLPSGARTRSDSSDLVPGLNGIPGFHDPFLTRHNEQRYLLQLGFVDRLIGRLLRRLKQQGMYEDALIVVTADHGISWQSGVETRRLVSESNVDELTPVPLIVKAPGQRRGRVSKVLARTLDVTPTIADVLGVRLGYRTDGVSAFGRAARRRRTVSLDTRDFGSVVRISARRWVARRRAVVSRRLRQFGSGAQGLYTGIGPNRELLGRRTAGLARATASAVRGTVASGGELRRVRRDSRLVPAQIAGDLTGGRRGERRDLAVAVNGRIEAVGRSFHLDGDPREHYSLMVPETALHDGRNAVEVFEVVRDGTLRLMARA